MQETIIPSACNCRIRDLGLIDYSSAYTIQKACVREALQSGQQTLLLCEHPTILTTGRLGKKEHILCSSECLAQKGIPVIPTDRGGNVSLHSPGQLVIYPIVNLRNYGKDLKMYLNKLEQVGVDLLKRFDIVACRIPNNRGVWVRDKKIISIGIGVTHWITFHGLSLNINTDLELYSFIKPCGLDVEMTSLKALAGKAVDCEMVKSHAVEIFCKHFNCLSYE